MGPQRIKNFKTLFMYQLKLLFLDSEILIFWLMLILGKMGSDLKSQLSRGSHIFGLKVWEVVGIAVALLIIAILSVLSYCLTSKKKSRRSKTGLPVIQIPQVSKEIKEVRVEHVSASNFAPREGILLTIQDKNKKDSDKVMVHLDIGKKRKNNGGSSTSRSGSFHHLEIIDKHSESGEEVSVNQPSSSSLYNIATPSPLSGLPESHLGWGHWFTLRDLEIATNRFSKENVIGEGGYGVVYRGELINGTPVAVKKILNQL